MRLMRSICIDLELTFFDTFFFVFVFVVFDFDFVVVLSEVL